MQEYLICYDIFDKKRLYKVRKIVYYNFINKLRKDLRADVDKNIYPEIRYNNRKIGVTFNGYLYDKKTNENLRAFEAYEVYDFLYKHKNRLEEFIDKGSTKLDYSDSDI